MSDNSGPAFPVPETLLGNQKHPAGSPGMTLRDYFAGQALSAIITKQQAEAKPMQNPYDGYAKVAYMWADAMLKAR
jgi:hypothetical protein